MATDAQASWVVRSCACRLPENEAASGEMPSGMEHKTNLEMVSRWHLPFLPVVQRTLQYVRDTRGQPVSQLLERERLFWDDSARACCTKSNVCVVLRQFSIRRLTQLQRPCKWTLHLSNWKQNTTKELAIEVGVAHPATWVLSLMLRDRHVFALPGEAHHETARGGRPKTEPRPQVTFSWRDVVLFFIMLKDSGVVAHVAETTTLPVLDCLLLETTERGQRSKTQLSLPSCTH